MQILFPVSSFCSSAVSGDWHERTDSYVCWTKAFLVIRSEITQHNQSQTQLITSHHFMNNIKFTRTHSLSPHPLVVEFCLFNFFACPRFLLLSATTVKFSTWMSFYSSCPLIRMFVFFLLLLLFFAFFLAHLFLFCPLLSMDTFHRFIRCTHPSFFSLFLRISSCRSSLSPSTHTHQSFIACCLWSLSNTIFFFSIPNYQLPLPTTTTTTATNYYRMTDAGCNKWMRVYFDFLLFLTLWSSHSDRSRNRFTVQLVCLDQRRSLLKETSAHTHTQVWCLQNCMP